MTERDYIDDFLDMMVAERGVSVNTVAAYRRDLEQLEELRMQFKTEAKIGL